MPKSNIYETARAPGVAAGKYSAGLYGVSDIWGKMESGQERFKFEEEQRGKALDTMLAALETTSTIYEGVMAKQEFKSDVRTVQKMEAQKAFGDIPEGELPLFEDKTMDFSQYIKTDPGKEWYEGFEGKKMGRAGIFGKGEEKEWGKMGWEEKIFQKPDYKFGEETLSRGAITARAEAGEYGYDPNFDAFEDIESSVAEMEERFRGMEGTAEGGTQTLLEEAGAEVVSDSGTSDTTSAVPGNIIALRPGRAKLFNPDVGAPTHPRHSAASEGGSLSQENLAMLTRMATTFKEREQAPVLGKDLSRFQTELDKIAADLGWTEEGLWND